jgi:hypothetical protein
MQCRLPGNKGIDHVFVKYNIDGTVKEIVIVESKFAAKGGLPKLSWSGSGRARVQQLSPGWMQKQMDLLKETHPNTFKVLKANESKIRFKANVLDEKGVNRWYDYGVFDPQGSNTAIRTSKVTGGN